MTIGKTGNTVKEQFTVLDKSNSLVSGIPIGEFSIHLYDPNNNEIYNGTNVTISELGNGHYYAEFIPDQVGDYMLIVYHSSYFPWGKSNSIKVFNNDFDTITIVAERILGLTQENFSVDNTMYDTEGNMIGSRIRIYDDNASVGTDNNIMSTYAVSATYTNNQMTKYTVIKD